MARSQSVGRGPDSQKAYHWIAAFAAMTDVNSYENLIEYPDISPVGAGVAAGTV